MVSAIPRWPYPELTQVNISGERFSDEIETIDGIGSDGEDENGDNQRRRKKVRLEERKGKEERLVRSLDPDLFLLTCLMTESMLERKRGKKC
jgi:hypothetical protein